MCSSHPPGAIWQAVLCHRSKSLSSSLFLNACNWMMERRWMKCHGPSKTLLLSAMYVARWSERAISTFTHSHTAIIQCISPVLRNTSGQKCTRNITPWNVPTKTVKFWPQKLILFKLVHLINWKSILSKFLKGAFQCSNNKWKRKSNSHRWKHWLRMIG